MVTSTRWTSFDGTSIRWNIYSMDIYSMATSILTMAMAIILSGGVVLPGALLVVLGSLLRLSSSSATITITTLLPDGLSWFALRCGRRCSSRVLLINDQSQGLSFNASFTGRPFGFVVTTNLLALLHYFTGGFAIGR